MPRIEDVAFDPLHRCVRLDQVSRAAVADADPGGDQPFRGARQTGRWTACVVACGSEGRSSDTSVDSVDIPGDVARVA
eukprot:CAMPEP_0176109218 /NCGR_PEP_ID=MMETSP0120_2-20121206/54832_1 /TAXON_ID=160619 /ORGANISM="Kryptoperidinium foliaceum, Strain CCMP 1326" /LENGTH=77 /DNA_ID=CAMNT_0017443397 /DNA_START=65 /DNA_END=295 /DNA_ORIENTATION=+